MATASEILPKMYQQPNSGQLQGDANAAKYTEVWKGPWSQMKDWAKTGQIFGVAWTIGEVHPVLPASDWETYYTPQAPAGMAWFLQSISFDENEPAGDHGTFTAEFQLKTTANGTGDTPTKDDKKTVWSMQWGTSSRSVLEYAGLQTGQTAEEIRRCAKGTHPNTGDEEDRYRWYENDYAMKGHVVEHIIAPDDNGKYRKILAYYLAGIQPMFHYPIVKLQEEWNGGQHFHKPIGGKVDKIYNSLSAEMPFTISGDWTFVQTNDSVTVDKSTGVNHWTHVQEWTGSKIADENFYGLSAWQPTDFGNNKEDKDKEGGGK